MTMKVGEVCFRDDQDFRYFKDQCTSDAGWTICYDKSGCRVSTKANSLSNFDVVRIQSEFRGISGEVLYDVIHDGQYRSTWDSAMIEGYEICSVAPNSDIGYYAVKSPTPFTNRDFVTQRCWLDFGRNKEKYIINHSVNHLREPPRKNYVRGISYLTGYLIVPTGSSSCMFYYMAQCDPGGNVPAWIVNKGSKVLLPKAMKKLQKACGKYEKWKSKHQPSFKPWIYPEQMTVNRLNPDDIGQLDTNETLSASKDNDEGSIKENTVQLEKFLSDD